MATDLHTPLESKKLEDRFAQFFLYQIMVRLPPSNEIGPSMLIIHPAWPEIYTFGRRDSP